MWQYPEWHILAGCKKYLNIWLQYKQIVLAGLRNQSSHSAFGRKGNV